MLWMLRLEVLGSAEGGAAELLFLKRGSGAHRRLLIVLGPTQSGLL